MEQKTILITGASRGIGKSIALRFASRGYHTFLNCSSSVDELKKLRAYIRKKYHTPCTIVVGDVGNPDHVRAIYNRIYHDCSHLDVLVNNAGISHINLLSDMTDEERGKFTDLLNAGFIDTFRYFYPEKEGIYSWWSYRFSARKKNAGWRIDYFCVSESLQPRLKDAVIHTEIMGSDHCPVELDIE